MLDRLPVPGGLVRFGVAPDHLSTKAIAERFATAPAQPAAADAAQRRGRHATSPTPTCCATTTPSSTPSAPSPTAPSACRARTSPGSLAARTFVGWYNAQPEIAGDAVDLDDVGRAPGGDRRQRQRRARHGPDPAQRARPRSPAPTSPTTRSTACVAAACARSCWSRAAGPRTRRTPSPSCAPLLARARPRRGRRRRRRGRRADRAGRRREQGGRAAGPAGGAGGLVACRRLDPPAPGAALRFRRPPGGRRASGSRRWRSPTPGRPADAPSCIRTGLVLRSVGYRSEPLAGLPFDRGRHTVPHEAGRVVDPAPADPSRRRTSWAGSSAARAAGSAPTGPTPPRPSPHWSTTPTPRRISAGRGSWRRFRPLVRRRGPTALGRREHDRIDRAERAAAGARGRPRVKLASVEDLLASARVR